MYIYIEIDIEREQRCCQSGALGPLLNPSGLRINVP